MLYTVMFSPIPVGSQILSLHGTTLTNEMTVEQCQSFCSDEELTFELYAASEKEL